MLTKTWSINFHYATGMVSLVLMGNYMARRVNCLQISLDSIRSRSMSRAKNQAI